MYEDKTYGNLLEEALSLIKDNILKGEGSFVYNPISVLAFELEKIYRQLDYLRLQLDPETADYESLESMAKARGIYPDAATCAQFRMTADAACPDGARFSLQGYLFVVTGKAENDYIVTCTTPGSGPNKLRGAVTPVDYVEGLKKAEITELLVAGSEMSTREQLLEKYMQSFTTQAFGGNRADYEAHLKTFEGVGGCRVFPCWNGATTVKCVLIGSDDGPLSEHLVSEIQEAMCPVPLMGYGIAPIGHDVTVLSVRTVAVNVTATITFEEEKSWADTGEAIKAAIEAYLLSIRKEWSELDDDAGAVVYIRRIDAAVLGVPGVVDIADTTLNGTAENLTLDAEEIPVMGEVSGGE